MQQHLNNLIIITFIYIVHISCAQGADTQEEHQHEEEPRVFTAEELQEEISPELEALCDRILEIIQLEQRIGSHVKE